MHAGTHSAAKRAVKCLPRDDLEFQMLPAYAGATHSAGPNAQLGLSIESREGGVPLSIVLKRVRGRPQTALLTAGERTTKSPKFVIRYYGVV